MQAVILHKGFQQAAVAIPQLTCVPLLMNEIRASKISKKYGRNLIFRQLETSFKTGVYGIAGANGSGKSTLMKCLSGLIRPDRGAIHWVLNDTAVTTSELYLHMGFSAPYIRLYPDLSCAENLSLIIRLSYNAAANDTDSASAGNQKAAIEELLNEIGLGGFSDRWYGQLSSGQQQRMRLASALIKTPAFLLLDEPGTNLDTAGFRLIENIIEKGRRQNQVILLASNEERELDLCDTIIDLSNWKTA
jgi:ABC-type multidrug transport system ATPase subunit